MRIVAQRGFGLIVYALVALAVVGAVGGLYWRIDSAAYERGSAAVRQEWQEASNKAQAEADAARKAQEANRATQEKFHAKRLSTVQNHARALQSKLEAAISASGPAADCKLSDGLLTVWNAANAGAAGEGQPAGSLPAASKPPAGAGAADPSRSGTEPRPSR